jgi:hypothetical protein
MRERRYSYAALHTPMSHTDLAAPFLNARVLSALGAAYYVAYGAWARERFVEGAPIALSGTQHRVSLVSRRFVAFLGPGTGEGRGRSPHLLRADAHPVYGSGEKRFPFSLSSEST